MSKTPDTARRAQSRRTLLYGAILVTVALLLILLSHFMNVRGENNIQAMTRAGDEARASQAELETRNAQLEDENERLQERIAALEQEAEETRRAMDELLRRYSELLTQIDAALEI